MRYSTFILLALCTMSFSSVRSQQDFDSTQLIRVFIDCRECDINYLREEVQFINYVRDKELADVHLFVTDVMTGSGGRTYHMHFIGMDEFQGKNDTIHYSSLPTATDSETREGLKNHLLMGLMPFIARTPYANSLTVSVDDNGNGNGYQSEQATDDPWNYWVFEIDANGEYQKESLENEFQIRGGFEAQRITEEWKTTADFSYSHRKRTVIRDDGDIEVLYKDGSFFFDQVKSLGPHWSAGLAGDYRTSTRSNLDMLLGASAAVEYNIFPYREVSRREFTIAYHIGMDYQKYYEETIYLKTDEYLPIHDLRVNLRFNQPWGDARASVSFSQYLHDPSKMHFGLNGRLSWRVYKGLSINLDGGYGIVRNQLYLPRNEATLEEILLRQKRIATEYESDISFGIRYTFGSMYSNVVNTRL